MRVIAGAYGGRRLRAPPGEITRPTVERVREALFNVLGECVRGASVLDCYAGSGSLGIEALSRGASGAVFVERDPRAAEVLRANLQALGMAGRETVRVVPAALERSVSLLRRLGPFDLCLVDPPFASVRDGTAMRAVAAVVRGGVVRPAGLVLLEYPSDCTLEPIGGLRIETIRRYGDTRVAFLEVEPVDKSLGG